jgi:hypothetical protein
MIDERGIAERVGRLHDLAIGLAKEVVQIR